MDWSVEFGNCGTEDGLLIFGLHVIIVVSTTL